MADSELCETLAWDSEFFGVSIARAVQSSADARRCDAMRQWCVAHRVTCLYFLCPVDDVATQLELETAGFRFVGSRVTLERSLESEVNAPIGHLRTARADDVPQLRAIAAASHHDTRFYSDGHFDPRRCDELYATWIEKSVQGYADHVIVAERNGVPVGYVTLHQSASPGGSTRIGLIGVAAEWRHQGVGRDLLRRALQAAASGAQALSVATAGGNAAALALYTREGFRTTDVALWYHRWFSDADR